MVSAACGGTRRVHCSARAHCDREGQSTGSHARRSVRAYTRARNRREKFLSLPDYRFQSHRGHRENPGDGRARPEAAGGDTRNLRRIKLRTSFRRGNRAQRQTPEGQWQTSLRSGTGDSVPRCAKPDIHLVGSGRQREQYFAGIWSADRGDCCHPPELAIRDNRASAERASWVRWLAPKTRARSASSAGGEK